MDHIQFMRKIGRKGGLAGKGRTLRKKLNRRAAMIRFGHLHRFPWPDYTKHTREVYETLSLKDKKRVAHNLIRLAMNQSGMRSPTECSQCGKTVGYNRIHAHHDDYERPMEVRFLCNTCHVKEHNGCVSKSDASLGSNEKIVKNKV